ncbi:hypothetical protein [Desulfoscipio geothermicus]|uniref:Uncharacterized protein n=1 Tax=Desulfoscipio geothermicus DSM 3669 TaxID=1121426 RepID=A0A1I6EBP6_9FIRM|nr:hypothetical protein [Desulfoscipio geothermicus]SFR14972.1 hypothetical protein SAMN05660706_1345 [Desulfoscipio geothermicus DSM 3669]
MRLIKLLALLVALLLLPGMAMAASGEQVVKQQVIVPSFDIWQHTNGTWQDTDNCGQPDYYGWKDKTYSKTFTLPEAVWKGKYELTRVEVAYPFIEEQFNASGRQENWEIFYKDFLRYIPANYSVTKTGENLAEGKVTTQWTFDLEPELLDLKDPTVRESLGMDEKDFSNMAQGWRWYLPVLITWYGVPVEPEPSVASGRYLFDGCFHDIPKEEGNKYTTYVIRAPMIGPIPVADEWPYVYKARLRVYLIGPYPAEKMMGVEISGVDLPSSGEFPKKVLFDSEVSFTKQNQAWVKKFVMPTPEDGFAYTIFVQDEGGLQADISNNTGVSCSVRNVNGIITWFTHTTSDVERMSYMLPWDFIKDKYGLSPVYQK